jgi:hypothetical protein
MCGVTTIEYSPCALRSIMLFVGCWLGRSPPQPSKWCRHLGKGLFIRAVNTGAPTKVPGTQKLPHK